MTPEQLRAMGMTVRMQAWPIADQVKAALDDAATQIEDRNRLLTEVAASWRETADIWERQDSERVPRDTERPPAYGASTIRNWINWLRACAGTIEAVTDGNQPSTQSSGVNRGSAAPK